MRQPVRLVFAFSKRTNPCFQANAYIHQLEATLLKLISKRVFAALLIGSLPLSACGGGSQSLTPISANTVHVNGHTGYVTTVGTKAFLYEDGVLVDTIAYNDNTVIHAFAGGKVATVNMPEQNHLTAKAAGCPPSIMMGVSAAQSAYNAATLTMILTLGVNAAADVISMGAALALSFMNVAAVMNWVAAGQALDAAKEAARESGCLMTN